MGLGGFGPNSFGTASLQGLSFDVHFCMLRRRCEGFHLLRRRRLARGRARAPARKVPTRRVPKAGTRIHGLRWESQHGRPCSCPKKGRNASFLPGPGPFGPFSSSIGGRKGPNERKGKFDRRCTACHSYSHSGRRTVRCQSSQSDKQANPRRKRTAAQTVCAS